MKKLFLISIMVVLVGLIFGSCAKEVPTPAPAPAPTTAPTSAPTTAPAPAPTASKPVELRFAYTLSPTHIMPTGIHTPWAKMIEERTAAIGKPVKIVFYGGSSLGKPADMPDMIISGVCDIGGCWGPHTTPGRFPLNDVMYLPVMFPSSTVVNQVAWELYETRPEFRNEFAGMKVLYFHATAGRIGSLVTRSKQVKTLEDFKGMKCTAEGKIRSATVSAWGGCSSNDIHTRGIHFPGKRGTGCWTDGLARSLVI